jgi:putative phage-type endonuclease
MIPEDFSEVRRSIIGASDVGPIMGVSPFATIHDIFMAKLGIGEQEVTEQMAWGLEKEEWIANQYVKKVEDRGKVGVIKPPTLYKPGGPKWAACHCDGIVFESSYATAPYEDASNYSGDDDIVARIQHMIESGDRVICGLEVKNTSEYMRKDYGDEYTDQIPNMYILQCQYSMWVTGLREWDVGVEIGGNRIRIFRVRYNERLVETVVRRLTEFWEMVQTETPPPVDATEAAQRLLSQWFDETDEEAELTPELDDLIVKFIGARNAKKEAEGRMLGFKNHICKMMGGAVRVTSTDYSVVWKWPKPRGSFNYMDEADVDPEIIAKHFEEKPPKQRTFTCNVSKGVDK